MRGRMRGYSPRPISDITPVRRATVTGRGLAPIQPTPIASFKPLAEDQLAAQKVHQAHNPKAAAAPITAPHQKSKKKKVLFEAYSFKNIKSFALAATAVVMIIGGVSLAIQGYFANRQVITQAKALAEGSIENRPGSDSGLDETEPKDVGSYKVAADMPRFLQINKLNVFSRILPLGTTKDGNVDAPRNVFDAGWYKNSSKPGQKGAMFIDGHVSGPTKGGIFANLNQLNVGDKIAVEAGNGTKYVYKVAAKEVFEANNVNMAKVLRPYDPVKPGLNIMTCNGKFDAKEQTYNKRLVVYAVLE